MDAAREPARLGMAGAEVEVCTLPLSALWREPALRVRLERESLGPLARRSLRVNL
jgi:hypothetical protein